MRATGCSWDWIASDISKKTEQELSADTLRKVFARLNVKSEQPIVGGKSLELACLDNLMKREQNAYKIF